MCGGVEVNLSCILCFPISEDNLRIAYVSVTHHISSFDCHRNKRYYPVVDIRVDNVELNVLDNTQIVAIVQRSADVVFQGWVQLN